MKLGVFPKFGDVIMENQEEENNAEDISKNIFQELKGTYPFCPLCVQTMVSLQNTLFSFTFNDLQIEGTLNMLMFYMRFFKIELCENKDYKKLIDSKQIYHFKIDEKEICQHGIKEIYNKITEVLAKENIKNTVPEQDYRT